MKRPALFALMILGASAIFAPLFVLNAHAFGCSATGCQLDAITNVPTSDGIVQVKLDGGTVFNLNQTFTFANKTVHTIQVLNTYFIGAASGKRYSFKQWTYEGNGIQWDSSPTMTTPPMYTNYTAATDTAFTAQFDVYPPVGCKTNCLLQVTTSVPSTDGTIWIRLDNSANYPLPYSTAFPNGTSHTIQVLNTTLSASNTRYLWKQWTQGRNQYPSTTVTVLMVANYTVGSAGPFIAQFDKQYRLTLTFADPSGQPVAPPAWFSLTSGTASINLTSYSGQWISALVWTATDAKWEGERGLVVSSTIDMTGGAMTSTITVRAYSASIKAVDNSSNPVAGATIKVIFDNTTTASFTTDSQGMVQLGHIPKGPYNFQVSYHNQTVGNFVSDASSQTQPDIITISVGVPTTNSAVVSSVVLLTIFGLALFLILLAIKVRKPLPPPQI